MEKRTSGRCRDRTGRGIGDVHVGETVLAHGILEVSPYHSTATLSLIVPSTTDSCKDVLVLSSGLVTVALRVCGFKLIRQGSGLRFDM
jgi:hypothetical protein